MLQFRRATVQNHKTGELEVANYRISKSAWLKDEDHEIVRTIGKRVEDMTSLTVSTAEELQVVNYGIGGHYEPHFVSIQIFIRKTMEIFIIQCVFRTLRVAKRRMHSKV